MAVIINLSKTLLLALLLLPAASWAMETDGFEPWKIEFWQIQTYKRAPRLYQVLLLAAAKKVGVSSDHFSPTVLAKTYPCGVAANTTIFSSGQPSEIAFSKKFISEHHSFPQIWHVMLHEMAHIWDRHNVTQCEKEQEPNRSECLKGCEEFADVEATEDLECFKCAQEVTNMRHDPDGSFKKQGYLNDKLIIGIAKKAYGTDARCPYHKEWKKRRPRLLGSAITTFMQFETFTGLTGILPASSPEEFFAIFGLGCYLIHQIRRKMFEKTIERTLDDEVAHGTLKI